MKIINIIISRHLHMMLTIIIIIIIHIDFRVCGSVLIL